MPQSNQEIKLRYPYKKVISNVVGIGLAVSAGLAAKDHISAGQDVQALESGQANSLIIDEPGWMRKTRDIQAHATLPIRAAGRTLARSPAREFVTSRSRPERPDQTPVSPSDAARAYAGIFDFWLSLSPKRKRQLFSAAMITALLAGCASPGGAPQVIATEAPITAPIEVATLVVPAETPSPPPGFQTEIPPTPGVNAVRPDYHNFDMLSQVGVSKGATIDELEAANLSGSNTFGLPGYAVQAYLNSIKIVQEKVSGENDEMARAFWSPDLLHNFVLIGRHGANGDEVAVIAAGDQFSAHPNAEWYEFDPEAPSSYVWKQLGSGLTFDSLVGGYQGEYPIWGGVDTQGALASVFAPGQEGKMIYENPTLSEPIAQHLEMTRPAYGVQQMFTVNVYSSMVPGENARNGSLIDGTVVYNPFNKGDHLDFNNPDPSATIPKDKMAQAIAWKKFQWWQLYATEEQKVARTEYFGKDRSLVTVEEYWQAVKEGALPDIVSYRLMAYNADTKQMQWNDLDPTKEVQFGLTDKTQYMTVYKNGTDSNNWFGAGAIVRNGVLEVRVKYPESNDVGRSINGAFILACNRFSLPLAEQEIKEINIPEGFGGNDAIRDLDLVFWNTLIFNVPDRGDIGPLTVK